ncbi:MAG: hypothetical protein CVU57_09110 [Deltaproteobacteria bacterium HGW-Deltaproteobacteria-15]|nr:MAG: hypothetical protein CVU57_09110 [Deltaproteobacteria bacterium HGW-Deltaproteobacteria-15]
MQESARKEHYMEPGQEWKADFFRPEDADGVVQLFLSVYGKDYPITSYIDPELLTRKNAEGRILSSVARTGEGDIVGHIALFCSAPFGGIRECGAGLVHSSYRKGGVSAQLFKHLFNEAAPKFGVEGVYGEAVCNHVFTQKEVYACHSEFHALEVDLMPGSAYEKEKSAHGRVATLFASRTYQPKSHRVFVPAVYKDALDYLYSGLDDQRELLAAGKETNAHSSTRMDVSYFTFAQVARFAVWEPGTDFETVLGQEEKKILDQGGVVIQVWLNLSLPWVDEAVHVLRERGYFLGGILPRWFDHDGLLMQKIMKPPDWESIQIHSDRARRIRDLVHEDWLRALKK